MMIDGRKSLVGQDLAEVQAAIDKAEARPRNGAPTISVGEGRVSVSAHCLSAACPHLRAPGAPCPGWAHHNAVSLSETAGQQGADDLIPDNGQVERMNRTIKDATVKRYFYETHDQLRVHLRDFVDAYNFAKHLKALKWRTPYQVICEALKWTLILGPGLSWRTAAPFDRRSER